MAAPTLAEQSQKLKYISLLHDPAVIEIGAMAVLLQRYLLNID